MKWLIFCFLYSLAFMPELPGQKKILDYDVHKSWDVLSDYGISNNGKYVYYNYYSELKGFTLVLCSTDGVWKDTFPNGNGGFFTEGNNKFIFDQPNGIGLVNLADHTFKRMTNGKLINSKRECKGRWLPYKVDSGIILLDLFLDKTIAYPEATNAWLLKEETMILLQFPKKIQLIKLPKTNPQTIFEGNDISNITVSSSKNAAVFFSKEKDSTQIYFYHSDMTTAKKIASDNQPNIRSDLKIALEDPKFSNDGSLIFFKLMKNKIDAKKNSSLKPDSSVVTPYVNVWSYTDHYLQSQQKFEQERGMPSRYTAAASVQSGQILQLENEDTILSGTLSSTHALVQSITLNEREAFWSEENLPLYLLLSLSDGRRRSFIPKGQRTLPPAISPSGKFITWCDTISRHYYSYEMNTGIVRNLTQDINSPLTIDKNRKHQAYHFDLHGWLKDDAALLIFDRYDIYQVDPLGRKKPIAITDGYGRAHGIIFRIAENDNLMSSKKNGDSILLAMWEDSTKENGFFKARLGGTNHPLNFKLHPYVFWFTGIFVGEPKKPLKAIKSNTYILQGQSATEAPNIFTTHDFKSFTKLSNINPQSGYNWLTAELVHWKSPDNKNLTGVLYKPENFNPQRKYPIIFDCYEVRSNEYNKFLGPPNQSYGNLDISYYVSNGYLVFCPDIHLETGRIGENATHSVVSAAHHLIKKYAFIDSTKMGLQGHSFGGYVANYVITQTNIFAAAQSSSGLSDLFSEYGGLGFGGKSLAFMCEIGQTDMGKTPWEDPLIYIKNSPLFYVDRVQTPLLIMNNPLDLSVPFTQGIEFFTALRRLRKTVWYLEYDYDGHILDPRSPNGKDFVIRQKQFFDHYLKDQPMPVWMSKGIPFSQKGLLSGLEIDSNHLK